MTRSIKITEKAARRIMLCLELTSCLGVFTLIAFLFWRDWLMAGATMLALTVIGACTLTAEIIVDEIESEGEAL
jgi:hypothetical protein